MLKVVQKAFMFPTKLKSRFNKTRTRENESVQKVANFDEKFYLSFACKQEF